MRHSKNSRKTMIQDLEEIFPNFEIIYANFLKNKEKLELYPKLPFSISLPEPLEDFIHFLCASIENKYGIKCTRSDLIERVLIYVFSDSNKLQEFLGEVYLREILKGKH